MTFTDASAVDTLKAAADRAMMARNPRGAIAPFERALTMAPERVELWIGLAACRRAIGDPKGALTAIEGALTADPRCFPALLMQGSLLESLGFEHSAAVTYGNAITVAPPLEALNETSRQALARAREVHGRYTEGMIASLKKAAGLGDAPPRSAEDRRIDTFIEAMAGRRKIYHQEPVRFHYPGLPAIEFFEREEFPWLESFESHFEAIRRELVGVWAEGSPSLTPYVDYPDSMPLDQWRALNHSLDWSVHHLLKDGEPVSDNCRQCPDTLAALSVVEQPHIPRRSPTAMFSILKAHTRIPPHTGVANTRLIVHLPLIVPENCGFRVGGETRPWREGEAWVFDDTIEHEAWNGSDRPRAILICDVWNPRVSPDERDMIGLLMAALDDYVGGMRVGEF